VLVPTATSSNHSRSTKSSHADPAVGDRLQRLCQLRTSTDVANEARDGRETVKAENIVFSIIVGAAMGTAASHTPRAGQTVGAICQGVADSA